MGTVTVTPTSFDLVEFDANRIRGVVETLLDRLGWEGDLAVEVDETSPMARVTVESREPLTIRAESGAFEDPKRPRQLGELSVVRSLARVLIKEQDRADPGFGAPSPDAELDLPHRVAWDCSVMGRLDRAGYPAQRQRWLYHFRNRCGFTDAADQAFAEIWDGEGSTWADLERLIDRALASAPAPG